MNDFEKLKETIMRLLTQKKFQKIYRILYIDKYFYWGREFIKISRKKKNRIIHFLRKTGKFQTNFRSVRSFIKCDGLVVHKENLQEVFLEVKKYCYSNHYEELFIYLDKKRFFRSKNNFYRKDVRQIKDYLNKDIVFIFIFENIFDFEVRRGKVYFPNDTKKIFVNENINNNQHYIDSQKLKEYFYKQNISKALGVIDYKIDRSIFGWIKRIFTKKISKEERKKTHHLLMDRGKIHYYRIDIFDSTLGKKWKRIKKLTDYI